ncbi:hypothetical protein [Bartonella sp. WD16.2]|uniref:hypothetical protein n=1 Tax=Bartonella sp. WD16.2 TaxID=1933904 RepID=UPI0012946D9B|nr:hypothetical protein [Bartonella sp. WD16.2]
MRTRDLSSWNMRPREELEVVRRIEAMRVRGCIEWLLKLIGVLKHMSVLDDMKRVKTTKRKNRENEN